MRVIIYNCKRCKVGRRVEYPVVIETGDRWNPRSYYRQDDKGGRYPAGAWITAIGGGKPTEYGGDPLGICSKCGHLMAVGILK